jgi:hypothetical protein
VGRARHTAITFNLAATNQGAAAAAAAAAAGGAAAEDAQRHRAPAGPQPLGKAKLQGESTGEYIRRLCSEYEEYERAAGKRGREREAAQKALATVTTERDTNMGLLSAALRERDAALAERDRAVQGGVMLAVTLDYVARCESLWRQQQQHDAYRWRTLENWCYACGYGQWDPPHPKPDFYSPTAEKGFPAAAAMLQQGVTTEGAQGKPRQFYKDLDKVDVNAAEVRQRLLAYRPQEQTAWPYYVCMGPQTHDVPVAPWYVTGPYNTQEERDRNTRPRPANKPPLPWNPAWSDHHYRPLNPR